MQQLTKTSDKISHKNCNTIIEICEGFLLNIRPGISDLLYIIRIERSFYFHEILRSKAGYKHYFKSDL